MIQESQDLTIRRMGWVTDDRFPLDPALVERTLGDLGGLLDKRGCEIEPIRFADSVGDKDGAVKAMAAGLPGHCRVLPVRVFPIRGKGRRPSSDDVLARDLSFYARLTHTDLMIAPSGFRRKFFQPIRSSFLSLLGKLSEVPLLVVDSGRRQRALGLGRGGSILFPVTDPAKCEQGFRDTVDLASLSKARVTVLFRAIDDTGHGFWSGTAEQFGAIPFYEPTTAREIGHRLRALNGWIDIARRKKVDAEIRLDRSRKDFSGSVLEYQENTPCDLVALDPSSFGPFFSEGALARLAAKSASPIWIARPVGQSASAGVLKEIRTQLAKLG